MGTKSANSVVRHRWPKPLKAVSAADGHIYYLIGDDGDNGVANVTFVDFYSSLNQFAPKAASSPWNDPDGFFFVRDAASSGKDHYGDPTVHAGWAMYIWDGTKYDPASSNSGWVKISQQGDTDWDITDELKAMFVLKTVYNVKMNEIDNHFTKVEGSIIQLGARVINLESKVNVMWPMRHVHINKEVLDLLSAKYGLLYYDGKPIGGNSYIYDHVEDVNGEREITWCDPTIPEDEWTHEVVDNSEEIANRFCNTTLARLGLTLIVVEADGSLSMFKYTREIGETYEGPYTIAEAVGHAVELGYDEPETLDDGDLDNPKWMIQGDPFYTEVNGTYAQVGGNVPKAKEDVVFYVHNLRGKIIVPKFAQTIVQENLGLAEYVSILPPAAKQYVGRGCWVPLQDDGVHTVNHLHKCIKVIDDPVEDLFHYEWTDVVSNGQQLDVSGSEIDICYAENHTMWTRNHLHFTIPPDTVKEGGIPVRWAKTVVVRKFGSEPINANDGEVVLTLTDPTQYATECFIDTVPYISHLKNDEPKYWYYKAFSTTMSGDTYAPTDGKPAKKMDWYMLHDIVNGDNADLVFHVGDEIYLPHHEVYGDILCEIIGVNVDAAGRTKYTGLEQAGLLVVTKDILCEKAIDNTEPLTASGQANPEAIGTPYGSNGELYNGKHDLATLNVLTWLNSTERSVYYHQTPFDTDPEYTSELGFLAGFESLNMFGLHPILNTGDETTSRSLYVWLPRYDFEHFQNITLSKRVGHARTETEWATMTGVSYNENTPRFKFYTSNGNDVLPEERIGIAPMFFLTGCTL